MEVLQVGLEDWCRPPILPSSMYVSTEEAAKLKPFLGAVSATEAASSPLLITVLATTPLAAMLSALVVPPSLPGLRHPSQNFSIQCALQEKLPREACLLPHIQLILSANTIKTSKRTINTKFRVLEGKGM